MGLNILIVVMVDDARCHASVAVVDRCV